MRVRETAAQPTGRERGDAEAGGRPAAFRDSVIFTTPQQRRAGRRRHTAAAAAKHRTLQPQDSGTSSGETPSTPCLCYFAQARRWVWDGRLGSRRRSSACQPAQAATSRERGAPARAAAQPSQEARSSLPLPALDATPKSRRRACPQCHAAAARRAWVAAAEPAACCLYTAALRHYKFCCAPSKVGESRWGRPAGPSSPPPTSVRAPAPTSCALPPRSTHPAVRLGPTACPSALRCLSSPPCPAAFCLFLLPTLFSPPFPTLLTLIYIAPHSLYPQPLVNSPACARPLPQQST